MVWLRRRDGGVIWTRSEQLTPPREKPSIKALGAKWHSQNSWPIDWRELATARRTGLHDDRTSANSDPAEPDPLGAPPRAAGFRGVAVRRPIATPSPWRIATPACDFA